MTVGRELVTPASALWALASVHRSAGPVDRALVLELALQMATADGEDRLWWQPETVRVALSASTAEVPSGVLEGVEALLALVYVGGQRLMHVERHAGPPAAPDELGPAVAGNGVLLTTELAIVTWVEDPGPDPRGDS